MSRAGSNVQILKKGQLVEGTIKKLTPQEILMDIGAKGDALVIEFDRQNLENLLALLKVGDRVTASVISPESEEGFPVVSLRRMLDDALFKKFDDLVQADKSFEVQIMEATRGGYSAQTPEGIRGFLPSSQVIGSEDLVGKKIQTKILEADRAKKRVVFSQKALSYVMDIDALRKLFKPGDAVTAEVATAAPYGLFVILEKDGRRAEGFVHISEISHDRVENLGSKFKTGEKITAQVIEVDSMNRRVNLSIKRTLKDEFLKIGEKYKIEDKIKGKVKDVKSRGITIGIAEGISGFIPADKVPTGVTYEVGQEVNAEIVDFDSRHRVIVLSPILKAVPIGYR